MKEYVSLTTTAMKMGKRNFYSDLIATVAKRKKNASLVNCMLNHPGHVTLASWNFLKFLPVVGITDI